MENNRKFKIRLEYNPKIILKFDGRKYTAIWNKKENNWIGKMGDIVFKINEK